MTLQDEIFEKHGLIIKHLDEGNHKTKCPQCQPPHDSSDRPMSVEISNEKIIFFCHHCEFKGGVMAQSALTGTVRKLEPQRKPFSPSPPSDSNFLSDYFKNRGISKETYEAFKVFSENDEWIGFPYNGESGQCDNIKYRHKDKRFKQSKDPVKSLYNYQAVAESNVAIFVEGEMDVLRVHECGFTCVTTLPDGAPAKAAYKEHDKRFKCLQTHPLKASKIILFCDADGAGDNLKKELLHRYGKAKCWYVKPPEDCKDANDVLIKHGKEYLYELIKNARPCPVDGLYTVGNYYSEVMDLYRGNYDKPVNIGYHNLDKIYKVMKGTFHVWTGIPNHGKSTFLDQCLIQLAKNHDWKFVMFSPEHSTKMHIRRLLQMLTGKPFDQGFNGRMTEEEATEGMRWIQNHFYFIETREHIPNIDKILELAKVSIQKFGCNGIVIDPYNEVDASRKGSYREDEHIRDFISKCKRFCKMHDITTWVVAHPTKLQKENNAYQAPSAYDISGAAHWHNQADAVVVVHRDFDNNSIQVITRKIREQGMYGQIGEATFNFDQASRTFVEPPPEDYGYGGRNGRG